MKCMNCGAELTESAYCPVCGCDVSVQKQAIVLSGIFYNQGLEKAQVRDLSGAIDQLRRSLKFNKMNISARNLLGLVYFETGEVVAALSEWVISKNIQPEDNIAVEYIENLQKDANRLDAINQTIKKYNLALENCHNGNEDVAMIQLKKLLAQNPKLIKGYHLLSLLYIKNEDYEKARRLLKRAIRIDKTNTTTLRFLHEVDEQTGTQTSLENRFSIWSGKDDEESRAEYERRKMDMPAFRDTSAGAAVMNILGGILIGAALLWFVVIPARTRDISREADERIAEYASTMAIETAQIESLNAQISSSQNTVETANAQIESATQRVTTYENLIKAVNAYNNGAYDVVNNALQAVDVTLLSVEAKAIYDSVNTQANSTAFEEYKKAGIAAFENFDNRDLSVAIENLEAAFAIDPTDYDVLYYLAFSYKDAGDTANADRVLQIIIDTFPNTSRAEFARNYLSNS